MAPDASRYRWSRAYGLRFFGSSMVVLAVLWLVAALAGFASWSLVLVAVGAVVAAGGLVLALWPPWMLEVSTDGYRLRLVRGGGASSASWSEVDHVETERSAGGRTMVVRLSDGRSTLVPLAMLGSAAPAAEGEVHQRLNAAFGYRRLGDG